MNRVLDGKDIANFIRELSAAMQGAVAHFGPAIEQAQIEFAASIARLSREITGYAYQQQERADVLAFLRKRQAMAMKVGGRNPQEAERARIIAEQIGIEIEMIEQGLHVGDAAVAATLETSGFADSSAELSGDGVAVETNTFNQDVVA